VTGPAKDALQGQWVHSHEEDTEEEMVFRPRSHPLPPSRGRRSLDLRPDGSYEETSPGPVDVPEASGGRWSLDGNRLRLEPAGDRPSEAWDVQAVDDRLVLRQPSTDER
jgi:hypothetical protein